MQSRSSHTSACTDEGQFRGLDKAKFGLSSSGIIQVAERLQAAGKADWLTAEGFTGRAVTPVDIPSPTHQEQRRLWQDSLGESARKLNGELDELLMQFDLDDQSIRQIGRFQTLPGTGRLDQGVELLQHLGLAGPAHELYGDVVECAVHVVRGGELLLALLQPRPRRRLASRGAELLVVDLVEKLALVELDGTLQITLTAPVDLSPYPEVLADNAAGFPEAAVIGSPDGIQRLADQVHDPQSGR